MHLVGCLAFFFSFCFHCSHLSISFRRGVSPLLVSGLERFSDCMPVRRLPPGYTQTNYTAATTLRDYRENLPPGSVPRTGFAGRCCFRFSFDALQEKSGLIPKRSMRRGDHFRPHKNERSKADIALFAFSFSSLSLLMRCFALWLEIVVRLSLFSLSFSSASPSLSETPSSGDYAAGCL